MSGPNDSGVSQIAPDGSVGPLNPEPNDEGNLVVPGTSYERRNEAEKEIDSKLAAIWDKNHKDGDDENGPSKEAVDTKAAADKKAADDKRRDEIGRFKAKDGDDKTGADKAAAEGTKKPGDAEVVSGDKTQTEGKDGQEAPATIPLPRSWSPEEKEVWDALPPAAQQKFADRESTAHRAISEQGQVLAAYRPLGELLLSRKDLFARHRTTPVAAIDRLLDVQAKLDEDAPRAIAAIARVYNVPISAIASALGVDPTKVDPAKPATTVVDPRVDQLAGQLSKVTARLTQREMQDIRAREQETARMQTQLDETVAEWSVGKEYFDHVREEMAFLVENDRASSFDEAYEMACYSNPQIRARLEADKLKAHEEKVKADAEAAKAKEKEEAEAHAKEARRTGRIQINGGTQVPARRAVSGKWTEPGYLEKLHDKIASRK